MEMWCPDDIGRDSWDWVGPPALGESMLQLPRVEWTLLACKTEPPQIVVVVVVVSECVFNRMYVHHCKC